MARARLCVQGERRDGQRRALGAAESRQRGTLARMVAGDGEGRRTGGGQRGQARAAQVRVRTVGGAANGYDR
jgi:hypothetical protein